MKMGVFTSIWHLLLFVVVGVLLPLGVCVMSVTIQWMEEDRDDSLLKKYSFIVQAVYSALNVLGCLYSLTVVVLLWLLRRQKRQKIGGGGVGDKKLTATVAQQLDDAEALNLISWLIIGASLLFGGDFVVRAVNCALEAKVGALNDASYFVHMVVVLLVAAHCTLVHGYWNVELGEEEEESETLHFSHSRATLYEEQ